MKRGMKALRRVVAVGLVLALTGCGALGTLSQSTAGQRQDARMETAGGDAGTVGLPILRVAMMSFIAGLPTECIGRNKLDEKASPEMDTIMFATRAPMNGALAVGLWDVGAMGATAVTSVANYDTMIISEVLESMDGLGVSVEPDSPIAQAKGYSPSYPNMLGDPEIIKDVTILLPVGMVQYFTTLRWLEKLGFGIMDVNIVNMDTVQAYQASQANQCDTVALSAPTFLEVVDDGTVQVGNLADLGIRYANMIVASRKAVGGKQELAQKYIDCIKEACKVLSDDPDTVADLMVNLLRDVGTEASRESRVNDLSRVRFITAEDWKDREVGNFTRELGEFYISPGQLKPELIDKFNSNTVSDFVKSGD